MARPDAPARAPALLGLVRPRPDENGTCYRHQKEKLSALEERAIGKWTLPGRRCGRHGENAEQRKCSCEQRNSRADDAGPIRSDGQLFLHCAFLPLKAEFPGAVIGGNPTLYKLNSKSQIQKAMEVIKMFSRSRPRRHHHLTVARRPRTTTAPSRSIR